MDFIHRSKPQHVAVGIPTGWHFPAWSTKLWKRSDTHAAAIHPSQPHMWCWVQADMTAQDAQLFSQTLETCFGVPPNLVSCFVSTLDRSPTVHALFFPDRNEPERLHAATSDTGCITALWADTHSRNFQLLKQIWDILKKITITSKYSENATWQLKCFSCVMNSAHWNKTTNELCDILQHCSGQDPRSLLPMQCSHIATPFTGFPAK